MSNNKVFIEQENLTNIANAIRTKNRKDELYYPQDMPQAILDIETDPTGDADATANDIAENKTAYVKGEKITGSVHVTDEGTWWAMGHRTNTT